MDFSLKLLELTKDTDYKKAYRRYRYLVKKHHPDKGGDADTFRQVVEAWKVCKDVFPKRHLKRHITLIPSKHVSDMYLRWYEIRCKEFGKTYKAWAAYKCISENVYHLSEYGMHALNRSDIKISDDDIRLEHKKNCWIEIVSDPLKHNVWIIERSD